MLIYVQILKERGDLEVANKKKESVKKKSTKAISKLNEKQRLFCEYYINSNNAYQSAINAGYKESTAKAKSGEWLKEERIQDYLDVLRKKVNKKRNIANTEDILEFWTSTMMDEDETKKNRLDASKLIAQSMGMFVQRVENKVEAKVDSKVEGNIDNNLCGFTLEELNNMAKNLEGENNE